MKLIATDYDGTLNYGSHVMEEDLRAINEWRKAGNLFVIATGRSKESIDLEMKKNNLEVDYLVTNNGGMVFDNKGTEFVSNYLDLVTALDIIYIAKVTEGIGGYTVNDGYKRHRIILDESIVDKRHVDLLPDLSEEEVMDLPNHSQIVISCNDSDLARDLCSELNQHFSDTIVAYSNDDFVNVVPKGVSKKTGLEFVSEYANIDENDIYVMGDSYNDMPLIDGYENSNAMLTAPADLQMAAKETYESIHDMIRAIQSL